jgi:uncharacterized protein
MANHPIVHVEIPSNEPKQAGEFYSSLFDWKLELDPNFNYLQFDAQGGPSGAFVQVGEQGGTQVSPGKLLVYIHSDDIDATLDKVVSLGGKTVVPKTEIPKMGWFGIFTDPTGNAIGLFTPMQM